MSTEDILKLLKERFDLHVEQAMDGSDDPRFLKYTKTFSDALQDVIDEIEK